MIENSIYKYDITSKSYDQLYGEEQFRKYDYIIRGKKLVPKDIVVDIGCGTGLLIEYMKLYGFNNYRHYICIEPSQGMLTILMGKNIVDHRIMVVKAYGEYLPLKNNSVDTIYLFTVWDNIDDKKKLLREIGRVLKPGGYAVISVIPKSHQVKPVELDPRYMFIGCNIDCFYLFVKKLKP